MNYSTFFLVFLHLCYKLLQNEEQPKTDLEGAGVGRRSFPLRDSIPADPKSPPFVLLWDIHFCLTGSKIFVKALLAPIYTYFEGGTPAKKTAIFFVKFFLKVSENTFCGLFVQKFAKIGQNRVFIVLWDNFLKIHNAVLLWMTCKLLSNIMLTSVWANI